MSTYETLKAECLQKGILFEDPAFPAVTDSIYPGGLLRDKNWSRPKDIVGDAQFVVEGMSRFDLHQGELGDCWFVASVAVIATKKNLFEHVVPPGQTFDQGDYAGIFRFNFWHYGQWQEVVVDDRLPVDDEGKIRFMSNSSQPNEFWGALLEKAYAKLYGSYYGIWAGHIKDALVDLTGGLSETYNLKKTDTLPENLFEILLDAHKTGSLLGAGIRGDPGENTEIKVPNGLYKGHAYSITSLIQVNTKNGPAQLVRLRNPWGKKEWNGAWSDGSVEWKSIPADEKKELGLTFVDDGEFWMNFKEFKENYNMVDLVHPGPDIFTSIGESVVDKIVWKEQLHFGKWVKGVNAGGAGIFGNKDLYYLNPQYFVTLSEPDEGDAEGKCTCIVSLMLQEFRKKKPSDKIKKLFIGFDVHQIKDGVVEALGEDTTVDKAELTRQFTTMTAMREVSERVRLAPGTYCIIPSAMKAGQEAEFMLRVFTHTKATSCTVEECTGATAPTVIEVEAPPGSVPVELYAEVAGEDGELDAHDLQKLLLELSKSQMQEELHFGVEPCRMLIAMFDDDHTCTLDHGQMVKLWDDILQWKALFKKSDADQSGKIDTLELRKLFKHIGLTLSLDTIATLAMRYGGKERVLGFEDFAICFAKTITMFDAYKKYSKDLASDATIALEEWMKTTLFF